MNHRRVLPGILFLTWAAVALVGLLLQSQNRSLKGQDFGTTVLFDVGIALVFSAVGAFISYRTRHVIGWLLLAIGIAFPLGGALEQYALYGLVTAPGSVPGTTAAAIGVLPIMSIAIAALVGVLLLFPTGAVRSPRWRPVAWAVPISVVAFNFGYSLTPNATHGPWSDHGVNLVNPLVGIGLAQPARVLFVVGAAVAFACGVLGIVSIVLRFRSSRGVERQQIKWLAYVGIAATVFFVVQFIPGVAHLPETVQNLLFPIFFSTLMFGIPLSIGAAILRYRLYDIDRIISRTVTYALVSAVIAGVYALVVLVPTTLLGRTHTPTVLVAAGTIVAAALFRPVRRRVQNVIDRRFNRSRYDAAWAIEAFTTRLRDEVDIDELTADLETLVHQTMEPAHVSVWLREAAT